MNVLFVAWQDPQSRRWIPVGRLDRQNGTFRYVYTQGAKVSKNFVPFGWMTRLNAVYTSEKLFPLFANRILPKSRPEYRDYLRWLGLSDNDHNELEVLARSGGVRETDTLEIFPCPEPNDNNCYVGYFFSHGLRYLIPENLGRINTLEKGERLYLARDVQNEFDPTALLMRTHDPISVVGYCPRYFSGEFCNLLDKVGQYQVSVSVEQVNSDAPSDLRLLCKIVAPWPKGFSPCSRGQFRPLADSTSTETKKPVTARQSRKNRLKLLL